MTADLIIPADRHAAAWMVAAHLLRPQGRRGELLADPSGPLALFDTGKRFALGATSAAPSQPLISVELESAWQPTGRNAGRLVLKLGGTDSIAAAEAIAGQHLFFRVEDLPALEEGTYRVRDLAGCAFFDGDVHLGTVLDLQFPIGADGRTRLEDAPDLLVVQPLPGPTPAGVSPDSSSLDSSSPGGHVQPEPEPVLVPFVRAWLLEVDIPGKRLRMHLPPGLFESAD